MNSKISNKATFYISLSALIMLFSFLIIDLISAIYFPFGVARQLGYGERVSHYYSFFTTQTNYLVALYFAFLLYYSFFKKTTPIFQVTLAATVYITITMLIFWVGIFTKTHDRLQYSLYHWINTSILHLIMPIIMIFNFIFTSGKEFFLIKKWHQNYLWLIALYPAVYSIVIFIRGHLRYLDSKPTDTLYPYYFFNFDQDYGILIAIGAIIIIFGLVFGLQYFYLWINNLVFAARQKQQKRLEKYYAKTLEKLQKQESEKEKNKSSE